MGKPLIEKSCSYCHKISWDNDFGSYNETHERNGKTEKCDTNGHVETTPRD